MTFPAGFSKVHPVDARSACGDVAQLGEHCLRKAGVESSNLFISTTMNIEPRRPYGTAGFSFPAAGPFSPHGNILYRLHPPQRSFKECVFSPPLNAHPGPAHQKSAPATASDTTPFRLAAELPYPGRNSLLCKNPCPYFRQKNFFRQRYWHDCCDMPILFTSAPPFLRFLALAQRNTGLFRFCR